jgi:hypothetical protein
MERMIDHDISDENGDGTIRSDAIQHLIDTDDDLRSDAIDRLIANDDDGSLREEAVERLASRLAKAEACEGEEEEACEGEEEESGEEVWQEAVDEAVVEAVVEPVAATPCGEAVIVAAIDMPKSDDSAHEPLAGHRRRRRKVRQEPDLAAVGFYD